MTKAAQAVGRLHFARKTTALTFWPAHAAFCSAAVFIGASGAINISYGWKKGTDLASCLTWAAVAAGVACLFALSWPALIRACERRQWSAAVMASCALILAGGYSVTAALGSAAGGRVQAERSETAATGQQNRAQKAYDAATAALAKLAPSRPLPEISGLVEATRCTRRVATTTARGRETTCTKPPDLLAELGRAQERERLQSSLAKAAADLDRAPPPVANSDAAALARYLRAVGLDVGQDRLNDLLVLLAVLMIEAGGGLSLAVAMALSGTQDARSVEIVQAVPLDTGRPERAPAAKFEALDARADTRTTQVSVRLSAVRPLSLQPSSVREWLIGQGGQATTSMRRLADAIGRSPSGVHDELRRMASSGAITMQTTPRGTKLALRPN
jgi:hypothetical protein